MPPSLADQIDALLPQTQCTRCGYPDCRAYAQAIAEGQTEINRCPPGGAEGVVRLAALTGRAALPLDETCGTEGPLTVAIIDEQWCIGCTLCVSACPVDCIIGAHKQMHTVLEAACTGCELCLPVCPVDCISLEVVSGERTGWQAWTPEQARQGRERYASRQARGVREQQEHEARQEAKAQEKLAHLADISRITDPVQLDKKRAVIEAVLARARARRSET